MSPNPRMVGPRRVWAPKGGGPKISRCFFLLPPQVSFFLLTLGGRFVEFWCCFWSAGALKCARLEFSGCRPVWRKNISHQCFLDRIPLLEDVQASWVIGPLCSCSSQLHDTSGGTWRNAGFQWEERWSVVAVSVPDHADLTNPGRRHPTHSHFAHGARRVGFPERNTSSTSCVLVQLGWLFAHGASKAPNGASNIGGTVERESWDTLSLGSAGGKTWAGSCRVRITVVAGHCLWSPSRQERTRRPRARDGEARVATRGRFSGGRTGQRSHVQQSIRPGEGPHQVTRRSRGVSSLHSNANLQGNDHPFPLVSCSLASQTSSAASPRGSCMPMWPSPRLFWPPSCCMSSCWGAEPSGFLVGEHSRPHLQRGWGTREDKRICPRFGCSGCQCRWWPQAGGGGWRTAIVRRLAIGSRHHLGVCIAWRRQTSERSRRDGWGGPSGSQEGQGTKVPWVRRRELDWSFLLWKLGAGSRKRRMGSWQGWPRLGHGAKHHSCRGVLSRHGECDGLGCSGARLQKLWLHPFWRCKDALALMGLLQRSMRWKGTSVMPALPRRQV